MSQSRFSIVLVGVSALLRRPLVSRLRPAGFTARGSGGFRRSGRPSVSALPLGELTFGLTASAFRHAPLRSCPRRVGASAFRFGDCRSASWPSDSRLPLFGTHRFGVTARRVGLRAHGFRFSVRTASGLPSASWSSGSLLPLFGTHRFGDCRWVGWFCRLPLRGCHSAGWPSGSPLPLFGTHRFGVAARWVGSAAFRFGVCRSAGWCFRLPLRGCPRRVGSSACRFGDCRSAGWPSGSPLPLFVTHRSAPPHRRREGRRSTPTRHLFHFKTLIPTC